MHVLSPVVEYTVHTFGGGIPYDQGPDLDAGRHMGKRLGDDCGLGRSCPDAGGSASPQQMLDFLAKPASAGSPLSLPTAFPGRFADWTETQRKSGFQLMTQRCGPMAALEHDNPKARILPEPMTRQEEGELSVGVCLPAHMPDDWPERRKYLDIAQRLIAKAKASGEALHLPANLVYN